MKSINIDSKSILACLMAAENIDVVHSGNSSTASFNVRTRELILPVLNEMSGLTYDGFVSHEIGHALYTPCLSKKEYKKLNDIKISKTIVNILEDVRIERLVKEKFPGCQKMFVSFYQDLYNRDFFGVKKHFNGDPNNMGFVNRINVYFKSGPMLGIMFNDEEQVLVDKVTTTKSYYEVIELSKEIQKFIKEQKEDLPQEEQLESVGKQESDEDGEKESDESGESGKQESDEDGEKESDESGDQKSGEKESDEDGEKESDEDGEKESDKISDQKSDDKDETSGGDGETADEDEINTQEEFDKAFGESEVNKKVYRDPVNVYVKDIDNAEDYILGYKRHQEINQLYYYNKHSRSGDHTTIPPRSKIEYNKFMMEIKPIINYMVTLFERKKSANIMRRTSISKTGILDMDKLFNYKISEDIFKQATNVKDGKNHGMVVVVDFSVSMVDCLHDTIKQLLTLALFARKINIPLEVYSFTNGGTTEDKSLFSVNDFRVKDRNSFIIATNLRIIQWFTSQMTKKEFAYSLESMYRRGWVVEGGSYSTNHSSVPQIEKLGGTPLVETAFVELNVIKKFKRNNNIDICSLIMLTDGEGIGGDYMSVKNYEYADKNKNRNYCPNSSLNCGKLILIDDQTKKRYLVDDYMDTTHAIYDMMRDRYDINVITLRLASYYEIKSMKMRITIMDGEKHVNLFSKNIRQDGISGMNCNGVNEAFVILTNRLGIEKNKLNDNVDVKKIKQEYGKLAKMKNTNKIFANKLLEVIS